MRAFEAGRWVSVLAMATVLLVAPGACSIVNDPDPPAVVPTPACNEDADCGVSTDCEKHTCGATACVTTMAKVGAACDTGNCDGAGKCAAPLCTDKLKNGNESAVDCGGTVCAGCADGQACFEARDCASFLCTSLKCVPCSVDPDCAAVPGALCNAGKCTPPKTNGAPCLADPECISALCVEGVCCDSDCPSGACGSCKVSGKEGTCTVTPAMGAPLPMTTCSSGLSCGGTYNTCQKCNANAQCGSGNCVDGYCCDTGCVAGCERCDLPGKEGTCSLVPAGASGRDGCTAYLCGGAAAGCPSNCNAALKTGCEDGFNCVNGNVCTPVSTTPNCGDAVVSFTESDVDCGGNSCAKCANGSSCSRDGDCGSGSCAGGVCCNTKCDSACNTCATGTCLIKEDKTACSDGWACTPVGTCNGLQCVIPNPAAGAVVYFEENFANNSKNWAFPNNDWAIGSAKNSPVFQLSAPDAHVLVSDPGIDHTIDFSNGVAGVVIGGLAPLDVHGYYWIESPPIDTRFAPTLTLEFWRWLTSHGPATMTNRVEVFNGTAWVSVWESKAAVMDREWTYQAFDITVHKNAQLKVRFGYKVDGSSLPGIGQWNLDDVRIATAPCGAGQ